MKFQEMKWPKIDLSLFDGGAAGGEGGGAVASGSDGGATGGTQVMASVAGKHGKSGGEFENVLFGKQETPAVAGGAPAEGQDPSDAGKGQGGESAAEGAGFALSEEDRRRAFMAMVTGDGEYKDLFDKEVQRIIDRRFRETKGLQEQLGKSQPVLDMLMQRYGIKDGDMAKLTTAVENDDVYWSQAAEEAGMSVEQYKKFQKLQRENEVFRSAERQRQSREAAERQYQRWFTEAEQVKGLYQDFDLEQEAKNPRFLSMLRAGVPVQHAYEVMHMDEIMAGTARQVAKQTEKQVVDGIRAKGARPQENGVAAQSGFTIKSDVTKLTPKERAEIARRARMNPDKPIIF